MAEARAAPLPRHIRYANAVALVFLFAVPCLVGRLTTYVIFACAAVLLFSPAVVASFRSRTRNPFDLWVLVSFGLVSVALIASSDEWRDPLFVFNFVPLLLALPFRWHLDRMPSADGATYVAALSLVGVLTALVTAGWQLAAGYERIGQPIMNTFQYADTVMLLGFLSLAGLLVPRFGRWRLLFLLGPVLGTFATVASGTRGALLAAPVLGLVAIGFAIATARHKGLAIALTLAGAAAVTLILVVTELMGIGRAAESFAVLGRLVSGDEIDSSTHERLVMLSKGWEAFTHAPVFGYGWNDMVRAILPYVEPADLDRIRSFRQLHNGVMSYAVGAGALGVLSFVVVSVAPLVAVFHTPRDSQFAARLYLVVTLCVAYQVFQLTYILLGYEFASVQFPFMAAAFLAFVRDPAPAAIAYSSGSAPVGSSTTNTA